MASCNPDADSWVLKWIDWWLDDEGYPDKEKQGKVRYYTLIDDEPVFADSPEELIETYPDACRIFNPITEEYITIEPKSIVFIGGTIFDNQILIKKNPKYLAELQSLPRVERARLLEGNWYVREESSGMFNREWLHEAQMVPEGSTCVRAWDKAYSEPSETYRYPDYTASIKMYKDKEANYYLVGDFHPDCKDDKTKVLGRYRKKPGVRDSFMSRQGLHDLNQCGDREIIYVIPEESQGKVEYQQLAKMFSDIGITTKPAKTLNVLHAKAARFSAFASACENGMVKVVKSSFNDETYNALMSEMEGFDPQKKSSSARKDD